MLSMSGRMVAPRSGISSSAFDGCPGGGVLGFVEAEPGEQQAADEVAAIVAESQRAEFSGRWHPSLMRYVLELSVERKPFLHSLDIALKATSKSIRQLILWNFICWLCDEKFRAIVIFILGH